MPDAAVQSITGPSLTALDSNVDTNVDMSPGPIESPRHHNVSVTDIVAKIQTKLRPDLDKGIQEEIAQLLLILPDLSHPRTKRFLPLAEVAAAALLTDKPNLLLARKIRIDVLARLSPFWMLSRMLRSSTTGSVLLGSMFFMLVPISVFGILVTVGASDNLASVFNALGFDKSVLMLVAVFGAIGSIVSIMVRMREFSQLVDLDRTVLFFTGFFKPFIGMALALFVYAVLNARIFPIALPGDMTQISPVDPDNILMARNSFFAAVAFICGFSERFAGDVASEAERIVSLKTDHSLDSHPTGGTGKA